MGIPYSQGASYGWRARVALLVPPVVADTNIHEFYLMAPPGVTLILSSLGLTVTNQEGYDRAIAAVDECVARVVEHGADVILQAGVPPIVTHGWGFEDEVRTRVAKLTSIPFITDVGASIRAMRVVGLRSIVMMGNSYNPELVEHIRRYLQSAGIELVANSQLANVRSPSAGCAPLEVVFRGARKLYQEHRGQADGIWLTQANIPSVGVIEALEEDLGVPVVTSAQALAWAGLRTAGIHEPIQGFGRLFARESAAG